MAAKTNSTAGKSPAAVKQISRADALRALLASEPASDAQPATPVNVLMAAHHSEALADGLISLCECANQFEDTESLAAVVLAVARQQTEIARSIITSVEGARVN